MNNKKKVIGIVVLVAILAIGIGYAAITTILLKISGTAGATTKQGNFVVRFEGTPTVTKGENLDASVTATATLTDDTNAKFEVAGLTAKGDKVTAKYTIKNTSPDLTAKLTVNDPVVENTTYFKATKTVTGLAENNTMELAKDATVEVELTVELIKTPVTDDPVATTVNMSINADPVQP